MEVNSAGQRTAEEERSIEQFRRRLSLLGQHEDQELELGLTRDRDTATARSKQAASSRRRLTLFGDARTRLWTESGLANYSNSVSLLSLISIESSR